MHPTTFLEVWISGIWHRIGWVAGTPEETKELRDHGQQLANNGGHYRLMTSSIYADAPSTLVHEFIATGPVSV